MFRKGLDKIKVYQPGKPIEEVKRSLGLGQVYKLASNEVPFVPFYIRSAINEEVYNINRYPESSCFCLRQMLAKQLKIKDEQIVFGNGSDEIIVLALRALIERADEVIVTYPTFLIYEIQAKIQGAKVIRVPLKNFHYDLEGIAKKVTRKTKLIFIANPDNPTGSYLNHEEVKKFLTIIPKEILVFFDEAYFEFAPQDFPRSLEFLKKRGNIIFTRTFSKVYALAGLRIGYGVTSRSIALCLNKIREPFNVNRFAQSAAIAALKNKRFLNETVSFIKKEKKYLYQELKKLGITFFPSATNFILIDFKKSTKPFYNYLLQRGVIVRELKGWGLANFFRVTIGKHKENKKFIDCLKGYLIKN